MRFFWVFGFLILSQSVGVAKVIYNVACESLENCPGFVAGLAADGQSVCTSVLVGSDLVATNLHCLPEDIRKDGASCAGRISFFFPATKNLSAETFECDKVKAVSGPLKDMALTPDWAFLKLSQTVSRPKVPINTSGFSDGERITIFKIDPSAANDGTGTLKKVTCPVVQKTLANPFFLNAKSPMVSLLPCSIVKGNSGSPLLTENLELKGVLNSVGSPADVALKKAPFSQVGFGSNFSCLNIPDIAQGSNPELGCGKSFTQHDVSVASAELIREVIRPLMKSFNSDVNAQIESLHKQAKMVVQWDISQQDHSFDGMQAKVSEITFKPSCINVRKAKLREQQSHLQASLVSYKLDYLEWALELQLDTSGRPKAQLVSNKVNPSLSFTPYQLLTGDQGQFTFNGRNYKLPFCEEQKSSQTP
ncbi:MAG: trypsin-like serine peptidase [Bdellovibrio sp.]